MSMGGSITSAGEFRVHGFRYRRRLSFRGGGRAPMIIGLVVAVTIAFVGAYGLSRAVTPRTADLSTDISSPPVSIAPPAETSVPVIAPPGALPVKIVTPARAATAKIARASAVHVAPVTSKPHVFTAPAPTASSPTPTSSCGTVASITQPVATLLPGPLGGSGGVVQTVTCTLP